MTADLDLTGAVRHPYVRDRSLTYRRLAWQNPPGSRAESTSYSRHSITPAGRSCAVGVEGSAAVGGAVASAATACVAGPASQPGDGAAVAS
jgi:hypothetical protein